jgi:ER lumen protein retaining receptor
VFTKGKMFKQYVEQIRQKVGHPLTVLAYFLFLVLILFIYHLASDGDFSFCLSLSGLVRLFAFLLLLSHLIIDKTAAGVSAKSLVLFAIAFLCRFFGVSLGVGYLPVDKSGDYLPIIELFSFLVTVGTIIFVVVINRATYAREEDAFGKGVIPNIPHVFGPLYILIPAFFLSLIFHPSLNENYLSDIPWTLALYLESVAVIPQLFMFQKSTKPVERWTSHYVFTLAVARLLSFMFWASSYHELTAKNDKSVTGGWVGMLVVFFEIVGLLILADYSYYWFISARSGSEMTFYQV